MKYMITNNNLFVKVVRQRLKIYDSLNYCLSLMKPFKAFKFIICSTFTKSVVTA